MSIFDIDYKEVVNNLYKEYSDEIIDLLVNKGILFEFECGFGGKAMSTECEYIESHLKDDDYDVELSSGCYYPNPNSGDTLYYIFNKSIFDYDEAFKIAEKKYLEINKEFL